MHSDDSVSSTVSLADLTWLPAVLPIHHPSRPSLSSVLGVGRTKAYALVDSGELPSVRLGHRIVVPTAPILRLLGVDVDEQLRAAAGRARAEQVAS